MASLIVPRRPQRSVRPVARGPHPMDRVFEDLWSGFGAAPYVPASFSPRLDVQETETAYIVTTELPGLDEKDVEIVLEDDVLSIRGEKVSSHGDEAAGFKHVETIAGKFERRLALPAEVSGDDVSASAKNGVVTITLPKRPEAQPQVRTIPVSNAQA